MPDDVSAPDPPPFGAEPPLTTIESFIAALVEAGPEVAEHMVRAAQELLLAAHALVSAAERNLAEQRRLRDDEAAAEAAVSPDRETDVGADSPKAEPTLRRVDEVA